MFFVITCFTCYFTLDVLYFLYSKNTGKSVKVQIQFHSVEDVYC